VVYEIAHDAYSEDFISHGCPPVQCATTAGV